jgi:AGZA family xanthine/uracil permease-like MFS transporter
MPLLEKRFQINGRGSNLRTEILAGMTTFATMAYIIILQPSNVRAAGMDTVGVLIATALVSGFITILMGVVTNMPIALAPGIASGIVLSYSIVVPGLATWQVGLGMAMISAILFLILSMFKIREKIVELIPKNIKIGISAGLGIFIIRTALVNAKLVNENFRGFGDLSNPAVLLAAIGIALCFVLYILRFKIGGKVYKIRGSLLITIVIITIIGIPMGVVKIPESIFTKGGIASLGNVAFKADILGALRFEYIAFVLAFFMSDFFGTLATALALGNQMGMLDENGNLPVIGKIFLVDAIGSVVGTALGVTVVTSYVESASGIEVGGKTGFASVITGLFFFLAVFFAPLFLMIPAPATTPVLIIIGLIMMQGLKSVDFTVVEWIPVGVLIISTLFYGISQGIGIGLFSYCIIKIAYYLFAGERGKDCLPSLFTLIFTVLTCIQFFL